MRIHFNNANQLYQFQLKARKNSNRSKTFDFFLHIHHKFITWLLRLKPFTAKKNLPLFEVVNLLDDSKYEPHT